MKKCSESLVIKYVYRSVNGLWLREDPFTCTKDHFLSDEFPSIDRIASTYPVFKVRAIIANQEVVAWTDKHKNIIIRVIDYSFYQTRLNL